MKRHFIEYPVCTTDSSTVEGVRSRVFPDRAVREEEQGLLLREQVRKQRHVDELDRMKFIAQVRASALSNRHNDMYTILDEASLPELLRTAYRPSA